MNNEALILKAVGRMGVLRFFPTDPIAREEIADMLSEMIQDDKYGTAAQKLDWLVRAMRDDVGEWFGPKEMRGIYCQRWKPSDGKEAMSTLAGFTGEEGAARASSLSQPVADPVYLPGPGDEPIGKLVREIKQIAAAKAGEDV